MTGIETAKGQSLMLTPCLSFPCLPRSTTLPPPQLCSSSPMPIRSLALVIAVLSHSLLTRQAPQRSLHSTLPPRAARLLKISLTLPSSPCSLVTSPLTTTVMETETALSVLPPLLKLRMTSSVGCLDLVGMGWVRRVRLRAPTRPVWISLGIRDSRKASHLAAETSRT